MHNNSHFRVLIHELAIYCRFLIRSLRYIATCTRIRGICKRLGINMSSGSQTSLYIPQCDIALTVLCSRVHSYATLNFRIIIFYIVTTGYSEHQQQPPNIVKLLLVLVGLNVTSVTSRTDPPSILGFTPGLSNFPDSSIIQSVSPLVV